MIFYLVLNLKTNFDTIPLKRVFESLKTPRKGDRNDPSAVHPISYGLKLAPDWKTWELKTFSVDGIREVIGIWVIAPHEWANLFMGL